MYEKLLTSYVDKEQETRSLGIFVNGNLPARDRDKKSDWLGLAEGCHQIVNYISL